MGTTWVFEASRSKLTIILQECASVNRRNQRLTATHYLTIARNMRCVKSSILLFAITLFCIMHSSLAEYHRHNRHFGTNGDLLHHNPRFHTPVSSSQSIYFVFQPTLIYVTNLGRDEERLWTRTRPQMRLKRAPRQGNTSVES